MIPIDDSSADSCVGNVVVEHHDVKTWAMRRKGKTYKKARIKFVIGEEGVDKENERRSTPRFGLEIESKALKGHALFFQMNGGFKIFNKFMNDGKLSIQMRKRGIQILISDVHPPSRLRSMLGVLATFLKSMRKSRSDPRKIADATQTTVSKSLKSKKKTVIRPLKKIDTNVSRRGDGGKVRGLGTRARGDASATPTRSARCGRTKKLSRSDISKSPPSPSVESAPKRDTSRRTVRKSRGFKESIRSSSASSRRQKGDSMTSEQKRVVDAVFAGKNVFFTGSAGTGKSRTIQFLRERLSSKGLGVCATTGVAACQIGGMTIHAWCGSTLDPESGVNAIAAKVYRNPEACTRWRTARTLIIDEISMLEAESFDLFERLARKLRGIDRPFGGIQVVLSGDFAQLPPVMVRGKKRKSKVFCFESSAWKKHVDATFELTKIFRQGDDKVYAGILEKIRRGECDDETFDLLRSRCDAATSATFEGADGLQATKIFTHRDDCERVNSLELRKLSGRDVDFVAEDKGQAKLLKSCRARKHVALRIGAQVMLVKSIAPREGLVNGRRGVVRRFIGSNPVVSFGEEGRERIVSREVFQIRNGDTILASRTQIPLELGYAISVHKSQGMQLSAAVIRLAKCFEYGQAYVALSRVKSLSGLRISGTFDRGAIRAHPRVRAFYEGLRKKVPCG